MKTLIKILIAIAILNAVVRGGSAAKDYYVLKDATQEMITFGDQLPINDLHNQILAKASELNLPVLPDNVVLRRQELRTFADVSYTQPVEFFPNYTYPWKFNFSVTALSSRGLRAEPSPRR